MHIANEQTLIFKNDVQFSVQRLIVIWALSESAFGGVLHALRIPLTGLFINGSAVIIIAMIAYFSSKKGTILKATLIVLLVKAAVSPHTPLNAYLAVSLQGLIGELAFASKKYFKISAMIFGIVTLFLSGIQRIIVLTILFGENLWDSIDLFGNYILRQFSFVAGESTNYEVSYWLIAFYISIHLMAGLIIGIFAGKTPELLENYDKKSLFASNHLAEVNRQDTLKKRKRKFWLKKPSAIAILLLATAIVVMTYVYPQFSETAALKAVIMVIRSIVVMIVWYVVAGPYLLKIYKNYIIKYGSKYARHVDSVVQVLPAARSIVIHSWKYSKKYSNIKRMKHFILTTLFNILVIELPQNEKNIPVNRS
jgi:hypothetical protein